MSTPDQDNLAGARAALRARQGAGARYDADTAPVDDLLMARRGTAYFARQLMGLSDKALYEPSAISGQTRAHIIARISYEARHHALALESLTQGNALELPEDLPSLDLAISLPARALRNLFQHSEVHLNICWRDLTEQQWDMPLTLPSGERVTPRDLPLMRAKSIWHGAVALGSGARVSDIPGQFVDG
ncbi:MAG: maleylpyruvate isomerase [Pseudooceanicola sp.]|nr:maleylpyruvate isomerase [Pseudooceanicola sp.]